MVKVEEERLVQDDHILKAKLTPMKCALPILDEVRRIIMLNHRVLLPMGGRLSGQKPYFGRKKDPIVKRGVSQRRQVRE
ncbi:hypothetical protein QUA32_27410, partial [Microcoleus sp. Pol14D6]|uniref:hypothetical protein n=1 Tax=unclassified Microcoleus TaxID=2642155 RepID=UPI002FD0F81C